MAQKMSTQDKVRARVLRANVMRNLNLFEESTDLGDRADRYGPDLAKAVRELAALENWEDKS